MRDTNYFVFESNETFNQCIVRLPIRVGISNRVAISFFNSGILLAVV